ncbi:hypothetical protein C1S70_30250 (plasmid) [Azospirillum argentinense]|uniref:Uncharacterized protein n=2 Tax=Azospirillum argentinense TaxID=2970906 RepID=A0A2K1FRK8_9PROT|nr:hypothetical protein C1S70_30250 [Azospirillum argentinense]
MREEMLRQLRPIFGQWSCVHRYAVDPGAVAVLSAMEAAVERPGVWFAEGWAAANLSRPYVPAALLAERLVAAPQDMALLLGSQTSFARTHEILRMCALASVATVFVFDHWKNYAAHFVPPDDGAPVLPDRIIVPDAVAVAGLRADLQRQDVDAGTLAGRIVVAGHPAVEAACERIGAMESGAARLKAVLGAAGRPLVAVFLDPMERSDDPERDPGYDWASTLDRMAEAAASRRDGARFLVRPHPRQDGDRVRERLRGWLDRGLDGCVTGEPAETLIAVADEVWGMTSITLVTALRCGRRIVSFQVGRTAAGARESNPHIEPFAVTT